MPPSKPEDPNTAEEIPITTPVASSASSASRPNALYTDPFPKSQASCPAKRPSTSTSTTHASKPHKRAPPSRDGLLPYITHPSSYPSTRVIYHTPAFVAIHDLYPKSSVHTLLLPRSETHMLMHPCDAFDDAEFLAAVKAEAERLKALVARELRRVYGPGSRGDEERERVLNGDVVVGVEAEGEEVELPPGRDWEKEVMVGVHAGPSMNHLHIHVLSVDRYSECLKHRKHYNSFATDFFVPLEEFPLDREEVRRRSHGIKGDMKCWRCGENFGGRFKELKAHLEVEFKAWKRE
ncbi:Aprataxin-like protein [Lachnellula cervina]|uniref:Aprataxin-like protein n=1 Tax=Lachnellula cervina TaxID=1316786 RepID=A0A7D8UX49_9HELO|nr:Aprataxin-like protein [Lachnellula cervina]